MPLPGLTIIGETINDSVPSTKKLFDAGDIAGILEIARMQDEKGAAYIDVNVGPRPPEFMADMVGKIQGVTAGRCRSTRPTRHRQGRPGGLQPGPRRRQEADPQLRSAPCGPRCSICTRFSLSGRSCWCPRTWSTAARSPATRPKRPTRRRTIGQDVSRPLPGATNDDCIIDPGIAPIGSDSEGNIHRLVAAMELIHDDRFFAGCHASVGLSNFTVMLPPKRPDGSPVKGPLETRFSPRSCRWAWTW